MVDSNSYYDGLHLGEPLEDTRATVVAEVNSDLQEWQGRDWHNTASNTAYNTMPVSNNQAAPIYLDTDSANY
jgi:hypothetical protein